MGFPWRGATEMLPEYIILHPLSLEGYWENTWVEMEQPLLCSTFFLSSTRQLTLAEEVGEGRYHATYPLCHFIQKLYRHLYAAILISIDQKIHYTHTSDRYTPSVLKRTVLTRAVPS